MTAHDLMRSDPDTAPALGESRSRVLTVLQDAGEPLSVGEVAARVDLHPNTVRFHLDALVKAEVVEREAEEREQPGRPRTLYWARRGAARAGQRSYRLLAEILTSYLAAEVPEPAQAAVRAGQAWGRYFADRQPPFSRIDAAAATRRLVGTLEEIGFEPGAETSEGERRILLHQCPFRETAEQHREVVCSIHLGLMQGVLAELDAPIDVELLEPFVEPGLCVAHFAAETESDGARPA